MENTLLDFTGDALSVQTIMMNLLVGVVLGMILKFHFERFSSVLSGKKELSRTLPFLVLIVCLIISIVKGSLALSLGLVGALSIVRFRTPIKEPEELIYLFMAIAMGLGLGANQTVLTATASISILIAMSLIRWKFYTLDSKAIFLVVEIPSVDSDTRLSKEVAEEIADSVSACDLKRLDNHGGVVRASFMIDIENTTTAFDLIERIGKKYSQSKISLIDQSRIPGV